MKHIPTFEEFVNENLNEGVSTEIKNAIKVVFPFARTEVKGSDDKITITSVLPRIGGSTITLTKRNDDRPYSWSTKVKSRTNHAEFASYGESLDDAMAMLKRNVEHFTRM